MEITITDKNWNRYKYETRIYIIIHNIKLQIRELQTYLFTLFEHYKCQQYDIVKYILFFFNYLPITVRYAQINKIKYWK